MRKDSDGYTTKRSPWYSKRLQYPVLYQLALRYLQIPATSTPSERAFSQLGKVVTKLRTNLKPGNVSMLHVLKTNGDLW
jgi:hypothetical protein